jgi:AraC-like DNA-binding protein
VGETSRKRRKREGAQGRRGESPADESAAGALDYSVTVYRSSVGLPSLMSMERTGTSGLYWDPVIAHRVQLHCEIIYVLGGHGRIAVDDRWYEATEHRVFFTPPSVPLDLETQEEDKLDLLYAHFHMQNDHHYNRLSGPASLIFKELEMHNDQAYLTTFAVPDYLELAAGNRVLRSLTEALETYENRMPGFYQQACALVLLTLHHLFGALMSAVSLEAKGTRYRTLALARRIRAYVIERGTSFSGAGELGRQFRMNSQHLSRVFKRAYGENVVAFANRERVVAAKYALINTDKSISEVAKESGFSSASHLQRIFRSIVGMSPMEFRSTYPVRTSVSPPNPARDQGPPKSAP